MNQTEKQQPPIDAVITWVDGNDLAHRRKREATQNNFSYKTVVPISAGHHETRFANNGEIRYCIASIRKFAPWVRKIHLVTDNQTPKFLTNDIKRDYNITIIDHRDIFKPYEWALPTFNSRTIETVLWKIPDLSSRFVYFNDDFVLTRPCLPEDFFVDGKVVIRGIWRRIVRYGSTRITLNRVANFMAKHILGRTRTMHLLAQMEGARRAGFNDRYFRCAHVPHPLQTRTFSDHFRIHPEELTQNIAYRFRDMAQYWPVSLANHLEIQTGNAVLTDNTSLLTIVGEHQSDRTIHKILEEVQRGSAKFLCVTALERLNPHTARQLDQVMERLLA